MNKANKKPVRSNDLLRRLMLEYFLALVLCPLAIFLLVILGWGLVKLRTWRETEWMYWVLRFVRDYIPLFAGGMLIAGWIAITRYFMSKPFQYLNELAQAAEKLASPTAEPIVLSGAMAYLERDLNLAREKALSDARAAREAEQRKNDLVIYLAHDLKTPLTSVIGYLTLLRDEQQISEELRQKYLSVSLEKAERLEDLINEFFEITRFNLSEISLEYSKVNLTRLLEQLVYEFQPMLREKNLTCSLEIEPDTIVPCDADKMQRVFDNLLRNAVNYSFADAEIEIKARVIEQQVHIRFFNHGNTIPPEKLKRIFEQFYRLDTARSSGSGGAGLGLAIAKEIVEHHHGTITAQSADEIIRFEVILPLS